MASASDLLRCTPMELLDRQGLMHVFGEGFVAHLVSIPALSLSALVAYRLIALSKNPGVRPIGVVRLLGVF